MSFEKLTSTHEPITQRRDKVRGTIGPRPAQPVSAGNDFYTDEHVVELAMGEYEDTNEE